MAREVTLTKATCNEQQRALLDALHDENVLKAPAKSRFRVAATIAGYSENTPLSQIIKPLQHLIIAEAESILARASLNAAWALSDIVDGDGIETAKDALRMSAAKQILDRTIAPKAEARANAPAQVVIMLPPKATAKVVEAVEDEIDDD